MQAAKLRKGVEQLATLNQEGQIDPGWRNTWDKPIPVEVPQMGYPAEYYS